MIGVADAARELFRRAGGSPPIMLARTVPPLLGMGTGAGYCVAEGDRAYLCEDWRPFGIAPEAVGHDLDPAAPRPPDLGVPLIGVQHHHAHIAAVAAEHRLEGRVLGVAFDDGGLGTDGQTWGGEFLVVDGGGFERAGHVLPLPMTGPGPVRAALAWAEEAGVAKDARKLLAAPAREAEAAGVSTSVGRLFDAVAALTGVSRAGHSMAPLERVAEGSATHEYPFDLGFEEGRMVLDTRPIGAALIRDLVRGRTAGEVAGRFHRTLAAATVSMVRLLRGRTGLDRVCLAGGVFVDDLLSSDLSARLAASGFEVFTPRDAPRGDGGIALGQVHVTEARLRGA